MEKGSLINKILKWTIRGVIGLLLLLSTITLILHLPPVQSLITKKVSKYLTETTNGNISIAGIYFSIWDGVTINHLNVRDPQNEEILAAAQIKLNPNLWSLILGKPQIDQLELRGTRGILLTDEDGLNIQFLIDGFSAEDSTSIPKEQSHFTLGINRISIHEVGFKYASQPDSLNLDIALDNLELLDFRLSTNPNKIYTDNILVNGLELGIYSKGKPNQSDTTFQLPLLNFGSGFEFVVNRVELADHNIAFHQDTIRDSPKFDPNHLSVDHLQVLLRNLVIREDSLFVNIDNIAGKLGDFTLDQMNAEISVGMKDARISGLQISTAGSAFNMDVSADYGQWDSLPENIARVKLGFDISANLVHQDFGYFLPDSLFQLAEVMSESQLELAGYYSYETATLDRFNLLLGESNWQSSGKFEYPSHGDRRAWEQVDVNATLGPEFDILLSSLTDNINWPSDSEIQLSTDGNQQQFELHSRVNSTSGSIDLTAQAGLEDAQIRLSSSNITAKMLDLGSILNLSWLGPADFTLGANGLLGENIDLDVSGTVKRIVLNENPVLGINLDGHLNTENADLNVIILDPMYPIKLQSQIKLTDGIEATTNIQLSEFHLGQLGGTNDALVISAELSTQVAITDASTLTASIHSHGITLADDSLNYQMDSLAFKTLVSDDSIGLQLQSDHLLGQFQTNFNLNQISEAATSLFRKDGITYHEFSQNSADKTMAFEIHLTSDEPLTMLSDQIDYLSELNLSGLFLGSSQSLEINANTGGFSGYGFQIDTLFTDIDINNDLARANFAMTNLHYDSLDFGDLQLQVLQMDSATLSSKLSMQRDSVILLGIDSRIQPRPGQFSLYIDSLKAFNKRLRVNSTTPIVLSPGNVQFDRFTIGPGDSGVILNGDLDDLELVVDNMDLTQLNMLVAPDSGLISHGKLNAQFSFTRADKNVNLNAHIDSLTIADSPAINIAANASTINQRIPFSLILSSTTNNIEVEGNYEITPSLVNARATIDIKELKRFEYLLAGNFNQISGEASGQLDITGPPEAPKFRGDLNLKDVDLVTISPKSSFHIEEEKLSFSHSGLVLDDFVIYDTQSNPLTLNGSLLTEDYQSFAYDLKVETDNYILIDNPRQEPYQLQGILVLGSDLEVSGNEMDTRIKANINIKDTTNLTYILPQEDLELLSNEGIVEFVDPSQPDSTGFAQSQSFYDSLIAALPEFNLNAQVGLEEQAKLQVIVNSKSGDFIEAQGQANLLTEIDRSGNIFLEGDYTITRGFYQLSFYDLVKKRFDIAPGSSIRWSGDPKKGVLNFKALYSINSSSIGLIGHEISESEREIYRKSLPYKVGIIISGTLVEPAISFDLDLPENDKISYPVLANKLERLRQPEFESELNKQVFGLLVLGGFIPEASSGDINSNLVASTAISNSVNSILASQLNRMAGQLVKGVDVNVALQSYSDFSGGSGGAQTRTAMDFRLTKRMMDDRLSIEVGGGVDIDSDQSGANTGTDNFRGDFTVIYNITESGDKRLKLFNNETYDIIYHEIRNTGISLIFIKDFDKKEKTSDP